jgi:hypothetical protein
MNVIAEARIHDIDMEIDDKIAVINAFLVVSRTRDYGNTIEILTVDESYADEHAEDRHKLVCLNDYIMILNQELELLRDEKEELECAE